MGTYSSISAGAASKQNATVTIDKIILEQDELLDKLAGIEKAIKNKPSPAAPAVQQPADLAPVTKSIDDLCSALTNKNSNVSVHVPELKTPAVHVSYPVIPMSCMAFSVAIWVIFDICWRLGFLANLH